MNNFASPSTAKTYAKQLMEILIDIAPNSKAKKKLRKNYETILRESNELAVLRHFSCVLTDGILYGNWPWIAPKARGSEGK